MDRHQVESYFATLTSKVRSVTNLLSHKNGVRLLKSQCRRRFFAGSLLSSLSWNELEAMVNGSLLSEAETDYSM